MSEYRDLSKLPDDDTYWAALEARITGEVGPHVRAAAARRGAPALHAPDVWVSWSPSTAHAWWLAGVAVAAGLAAVVFMPPVAARNVSLRGPWAIVSPSDPSIATALALDAPAPPPVAALVLPGRSPANE